MKVWINNPFDFLPGAGGRLQRFGLLSQALARAGHDVVWFSSDWCHLRKCRRSAPGREIIRKEMRLADEDGEVEIRVQKTLPYYRNISWGRVRSHLSYERGWPREANGERRPDLIVVSMPPMGTAKIARRWRVPVVIDIMDIWPDTFYRTLPRAVRFLGPVIFFPLKSFMRTCYRDAQGVVAVTPSYVKKTGRSDCRVFPLGITLPSWKARPRQKNFTFCYIGNLGWSYRLDVCVEALKLFQKLGVPVSLEIAGDGPQREYIQSCVQEGLPIHYHGLLAGQELDALLDRADCGIVPMLSGMGVGIPNKVFDYAAHGLAVLNGLKGESEKMVLKYGAGSCYEVDQPDSFVKGALPIIQNPELWGRMCSGSRRMAEERFDASKIYPEYVAWLEGICGKGR